ncbi:MAG: hypothetical protein HUU11_17710 [Anaerolineales bacterium]|nr:hypothetical protein [Anaerolineales bacterium]
MKPDAAPVIHSFIIRFVVEDAPVEKGEQSVYHGAIRHIQNAEELNFTEWREAMEFMRRYVPLVETDEDKSRPT